MRDAVMDAHERSWAPLLYRRIPANTHKNTRHPLFACLHGSDCDCSFTEGLFALARFSLTSIVC